MGPLRRGSQDPQGEEERFDLPHITHRSQLEGLIQYLKDNFSPQTPKPGTPHDDIMFRAGMEELAAIIIQRYEQ